MWNLGRVDLRLWTWEQYGLLGRVGSRCGLGDVWTRWLLKKSLSAVPDRSQRGLPASMVLPDMSACLLHLDSSEYRLGSMQIAKFDANNFFRKTVAQKCAFLSFSFLWDEKMILVTISSYERVTLYLFLVS